MAPQKKNKSTTDSNSSEVELIHRRKTSHPYCPCVCLCVCVSCSFISQNKSSHTSYLISQKTPGPFIEVILTHPNWDKLSGNKKKREEIEMKSYIYTETHWQDQKLILTFPHTAFLSLPLTPEEKKLLQCCWNREVKCKMQQEQLESQRGTGR